MGDPREQWLLAGQRLLRRGGHSAVKLTPLTHECGLTSGSFYHHFKNLAQYHRELADYYGHEQPAEYLRLVDHPDPRIRLKRVDEFARSESMGPLDAAMRSWAAVDEHADRAVRAADEILLRFLVGVFADMGLDEPEIRAHFALALAVAQVRVPWRRRSADRYVAVLAAQTRSDVRSGKPRE